MTLFHIILVVVMSAVLVVSSPGHLIRLPPAVMQTLLESDFCGQKSTTMRVYVGVFPSACIFCDLCVVHHKNAVLPFGLSLIVALGHASDLLSESCLPRLSYFRVSIPCKLFVLGDRPFSKGARCGFFTCFAARTKSSFCFTTLPRRTNDTMVGQA